MGRLEGPPRGSIPVAPVAAAALEPILTMTVVVPICLMLESGGCLQVAAQAGYSALVKQYRAILDPSLKGVPPPELSATPPINKAEEQQGLDQAASSETWAAQITEDDEDLEADLQRSRIHSPSQQDLQEAADLSGMSIKDRSDQNTDLLGIGSDSVAHRSPATGTVTPWDSLSCGLTENPEDMKGAPPALPCNLNL